MIGNINQAKVRPNAREDTRPVQIIGGSAEPKLRGFDNGKPKKAQHIKGKRDDKSLASSDKIPTEGLSPLLWR